MCPRLSSSSPKSCRRPGSPSWNPASKSATPTAPTASQLLPALAERRRRDHPQRDHHRRRGDRARAPAAGRRPGRRRPGQRRRRGGDQGRGHGGQRADLQHRERRRARGRAAAGAAAQRAAGAWPRCRAGSGSGPRSPASSCRTRWSGILGLGKIGVLVAQRLAAFGMTVIAYDPYVAAARAAQLGVRLVGLDELLAESDFISVHLPKNAETIGLSSDRRAGPGQAGGADHQRGPRRHRGRGRAGPARSPTAGSPGRRSMCTPPSRAPTARCSACPTWWSPRTWARAPTRRRRRPAPRWPGRSGWPWRASSCRTR